MQRVDVPLVPVDWAAESMDSVVSVVLDDAVHFFLALLLVVF